MMQYYYKSNTKTHSLTTPGNRTETDMLENLEAFCYIYIVWELKRPGCGQLEIMLHPFLSSSRSSSSNHLDKFVFPQVNRTHGVKFSVAGNRNIQLRNTGHTDEDGSVGNVEGWQQAVVFCHQ